MPDIHDISTHCSGTGQVEKPRKINMYRYIKIYEYKLFHRKTGAKNNPCFPVLSQPAFACLQFPHRYSRYCRAVAPLRFGRFIDGKRGRFAPRLFRDRSHLWPSAVSGLRFQRSLYAFSLNSFTHASTTEASYRTPLFRSISDRATSIPRAGL